MSASQSDNANSQAVPFFARFLEGQNCEDISDETSEAISGGANGFITNPPADLLFSTLKYPSDGDDQVVK